jgi:hypothetical protein
MLISVKGEPIIRDERRGRWEYVKDTVDNWRGYLHMDCDSITDDTGHCIMCGAPCPTLWNMEV